MSDDLLKRLDELEEDERFKTNFHEAETCKLAAARIRELERLLTAADFDAKTAHARIRELEAELEELRGFYSKHSMTEHMLDRGTHVIVPVEPTPEMAERGANTGFTATAARASVSCIYRAMIRTAQEKD